MEQPIKNPTLVGAIVAGGIGLAAVTSAWVLVAIGLLAVLAAMAVPASEWSGRLRRLRRDVLPVLPPTIKNRLGKHEWEKAATQAGWPPGVPMPDGRPLAQWYDDNYERLTDPAKSLCTLAISLYPHGATQGPSPEFHRARGELKDFLDDCGHGLWRPWARGWVQRNVMEIYPHFVIMLAYLELALAKAIPEASERGARTSGLWKLGNWWFS